MSDTIDPEAELAFQLAFRSVFHRVPGAFARPNPRPLMFVSDGVGAEAAAEPLARRHAKDVVMLTYAPGREADGPANFAVCEWREGVLHLWPECRPWADGEDGPLILLAKDEPVGFCHDGRSLVMMWNAPVTGVGDGVAIARRRLASMVDYAPGDVRLRPDDPAFARSRPRD